MLCALGQPDRALQVAMDGVAQPGTYRLTIISTTYIANFNLQQTRNYMFQTHNNCHRCRGRARPSVACCEPSVSRVVWSGLVRATHTHADSFSPSLRFRQAGDKQAEADRPVGQRASERDCMLASQPAAGKGRTSQLARLAKVPSGPAGGEPA